MTNMKNNIKFEESQSMKEIKASIQKYTRYIDDKMVFAVKVYDCNEDEQTYDVEISLFIDEEYEGGWCNQTYYGNCEDDELALKEAVKRAKAVLKSVKSWYEYHEDITVRDYVEVYS